MRRALGLLALLLLPAALAAAQGAPGAVGPGELHLPGPLVVAPNETLRLRPGTTLLGPGHVEVWGSLEAPGTPEAPIVLRVPIAFLGNGTSRLEHARVEGIGGAALTVRNGSLTIQNVTFASNRIGLVVAAEGRAHVDVVDARFTGHHPAGARIEGNASAHLLRTTFEGNGLGVWARLSAPLDLRLDHARFVDNDDHALLDFAARPDPAAGALVANSTFEGPRGALVVTSDLSTDLAPSARAPLVQLRDNRFLAADVGATVRGAGYRLESRNDSFEGTRIGMSIGASRVTLLHTRFDTLERDLDLSTDARLTTQGVRFTPAPAPAPDAAPPWMPIALTGAGTLALGGALLVARRARRPTRLPVRAHDTLEAAAVASDAPPPRAFTPMEQRILRDLAAHPDSPQADVARRLDLTRQALHYHVKKLAAEGVLVKTVHGRTTRCRLAPGVAPPPSPPLVTRKEGPEKA